MNVKRKGAAHAVSAYRSVGGGADGVPGSLGEPGSPEEPGSQGAGSRKELGSPLEPGSGATRRHRRGVSPRRRRRGPGARGAGIAVLACALGLTAAGALSAAPAATAHAAVKTAADVTRTAKTTDAPATHAAGTPNYGQNYYVFPQSMPQSQIQDAVNSIATQQVPNQFGSQRYTLLFEPGTYGS